MICTYQSCVLQSNFTALKILMLCPFITAIPFMKSIAALNGAFKGISRAWLSLGIEKESSPKTSLGLKRLELIDSGDLLSICFVPDMDAEPWDVAASGTPGVPAFTSFRLLWEVWWP